MNVNKYSKRVLYFKYFILKCNGNSKKYKNYDIDREQNI